jgi:hypothetical protein
MNDEPPKLTTMMHKLLEATAPTSKDWVLYCASCCFVGEKNAAYATSFMADHNPEAGCSGKLRIWRGQDDFTAIVRRPLAY